MRSPLARLHVIKLPIVTITLAIVSSFGFATTTAAISPSNQNSSVGNHATTTTSQTQLTNLVNRGNSEIQRRLTALQAVATRISSMKHLQGTDQATLTSEVTTTENGLTALKTKLDAETTLTAAKTDVQNIISEYRVYLLVLPKVWLVKTADDQQVSEANYTTLATKLQTRLGNGGSSVAVADLVAARAALVSAESISVNVETSVVPLSPTDYNTNHTVMANDYTQLKTAHADILTAAADLQTAIASLKS